MLMQYWKPAAENEFAGDMMPYWDGQQFHLFYLLDRGHHAEQGGLGGHQWAHASTSDLVNWEHHPLAVPIGAPGSVDQHGICTGSIFEHDGVYHAFYATRIKGPDGTLFEALCRAAGTDLVHFDKSSGNPMFGASAGLDPRNHRDPFVFRHADTGKFHMLVTSTRERIPEFEGEGGVLAQYVSDDLDTWEAREPFLALDKDPAPECPEHFFWNGWWYLIYSQGGQMQYQVSRDPLGPWQRVGTGTIDGSNLAVPRTALYKDGRRLAVGFLPWREDGRDDKGYVYAGNVVFRELFTDADGGLMTRFVPEMMPVTGPAVSAPTVSLQDETQLVIVMETPGDAALTCRLMPGAGASEYGLLLRADEGLTTGYRLCFTPGEGRMTLRGWPNEGQLRAEIAGLEGLEHGVELAICLQGSVLDVCVNGRRTAVERGFDHAGTHLGLFATGGSVRVEGLRVAPIL